jgi:hypothetical protein
MEELQGPEVVHLHLAPRSIEDRRISDSSGKRHPGVAEDERDVRRRVSGRANLIRVGDVEPQRNKPLVTQGA